MIISFSKEFLKIPLQWRTSSSRDERSTFKSTFSEISIAHLERDQHLPREKHPLCSSLLNAACFDQLFLKPRMHLFARTLQFYRYTASKRLIGGAIENRFEPSGPLEKINRSDLSSRTRPTRCRRPDTPSYLVTTVFSSLSWNSDVFSLILSASYFSLSTRRLRV